MSTPLNSPIDYDQLATAGGPVSFSKQIGYGTFFLSATSLVHGDSFDQVKVTFINSAGQFSGTGIFLNPQNTTEVNLVLNSGLMTLNITQIELYPPTPDTPGSVLLNAHWTDLNGNEKKNFNGTIASWTNPPKA